ncbi:MAG: SprT-like domain-containing protein [Campylobacteraceae bacterium]|jgi:predicted SprT family Zn-dependent metalloprotease|nr:SprT-like domain-containing protein [Campylobacteraceae bacterium]
MDLIVYFLNELRQKALIKYNLGIKTVIKVNLKGSRLIGQCVKDGKKSYIIRLHTELLKKFRERYIKDVLTHEFAHAVQMELFAKSKPHGREWKSIMESLNDAPYKKSNIDYCLKNGRALKTYRYKCDCHEYLITSIRHNKIVYGTSIYKCKKCGQVLKLSQ